MCTEVNEPMCRGGIASIGVDEVQQAGCNVALPPLLRRLTHLVERSGGGPLEANPKV